MYIAQLRRAGVVQFYLMRQPTKKPKPLTRNLRGPRRALNIKLSQLSSYLNNAKVCICQMFNATDLGVRVRDGAMMPQPTS